MRTTLLMLTGWTCLSIAPPEARAPDVPSAVGDWEGLLPVSAAMELRLVFHVEEAKDGKVKATLDSPDEAILGLAVQGKAAPDGGVTLATPKIKAEYAGKLDAKGQSIVGTWEQLGKTWPLTFTKMAAPDPKPTLWEGKLKAGAVELRIVVRVTKKADGTFRATLDSPDQGARAIKIDSVTLDGKALNFTSKAIVGEFSGKLNAEGTEAVGQFKQLGMSNPLTLKKTDTLSVAKRPQTPKPPFPYREEQVSYPNAKAGISLAGTLTLPPGAGPFPAAILITGSGPQDRDETILGHKPFLVLADYLSRRGIAVLRVDDRGVGGSTGGQEKATSEDFADDVVAGIAFLKARKEIDRFKIGLIGHSEGGLIAPMVGEKSPDVAYMVLLAGPGVPGDEILVAQGALIAKAGGASDDDIAKQTAISKKMYAAIRTEKDEAALVKTMTKLVEEMIAAMPEAQRKALGDDGAKSVGGQLGMLKTPWFRYFLTYDPRPALAKVKCPVLAINGEKDLQVPPKENLAAIAKALKTGGNARVKVQELPGLNHLFQASKTGAPSEYAQIEETFAPSALKVVGDWIAGQVGAK